MAGDLRKQAEHQDRPLPQTMPDHSARPLDKPPPPPSSTAPPDTNEPNKPPPKGG